MTTDNNTKIVVNKNRKTSICTEEFLTLAKALLDDVKKRERINKNTSKLDCLPMVNGWQHREDQEVLISCKIYLRKS